METMVSYLQGIGLPVEREGSGYKLKTCPLCQHNDCFKISPEGYFKCFSCQAAGDQFKFESLRQGITYREAKEQITGATIISLPDPEMDKVDRNHRRLVESSEYLKWLTEQRRITIDVVKRFKIGCFVDDESKCVYSFPYLDGSYVSNIKYRTIDKKIFFKRGGTEFLYNKNALRNADAVLVVEGEMDCLAAYTYNIKLPCVSVGLGAGSHKLSWKDDFAGVKTIYLAFDNDSAGRSGVMKLAEVLGREKCRLVRLPLKDLNDCLIQGIESEDIEACIQRSMTVEQVEIMNALEAIPIDEPVLGEKLGPILEMIADRSQTELEDYIRAIRNRFPGVSYRQSIDFRNRVRAIQYRNRQQDDAETPTHTPMSESLEREAMVLLKNPNIIETIHEWLGDIGIVGEDFNRICLFLFFLSRKLDKPTNAICYGQSSSGKSELVKKVLSTVPEEDVLQFTSMSGHALDYRDDLIGKVVFIAEMDGVQSDEIEYAVRIAMSEGKLIRGYTIKDEDTGEMKNVEKVTEVRSCFVMTTTRSSSHNENATRMWNLYIDESIKQTQRVLEYIKNSQSREYRRDEPKRQHKIDVLKAAQRLLRPIEIEVPYAHLLEFPDNTTRTRRDLSRFISFVKVVAFLRQFQKEIKTDELSDYIQADLTDYNYAYNFLLPILRNTLDEITPRGMTVLEACCHLQNERPTLIEEASFFTVKDLQVKGVELGLDFKNVVNLRQELQTLCDGEFIELVGGAWGAKGGRHKFKVICSYEIENGEIKNVRSQNAQILTPDQLASLIKSK